MARIIALLKNYWFFPVGAIVGGLAGYLYWLYVGCETGTCPITASPTRTSLYWAVMGVLGFSIFGNRKKKDDE